METLQDRYEIYVQCADDGTGHEVCASHTGKDCPCIGSGPALKSFDEWHTISGPVQAQPNRADIAEVEPGTCIYCDAINCESDPPSIDDDETWTRYALEHSDFCEWILTRAHQLEEA